MGAQTLVIFHFHIYTTTLSVEAISYTTFRGRSNQRQIRSKRGTTEEKQRHKEESLILMEAFRQRSSLPQKPSGKGAEGPKDALEGRRGSSLGVAESTQEVSVSSVSRSGLHT